MGHDWVYFIHSSDLPKYMQEVLGFSLYEVGLYTSLPYLVMWPVSVLSGIICDYLVNSGYMTVVQARKIFTAACKCYCKLTIVPAGLSN